MPVGVGKHVNKNSKIMSKEKVIDNLERFDYSHSAHGDILKINLEYSLEVIIDFSEQDKIKIKDHLAGWNFLTGMIKMSIKSAMLYNFIGSLVATILFLYLDSQIEQINLMIIYLFVISWILSWTTFYVIKTESFKRQVIDWTKK